MTFEELSIEEKLKNPFWVKSKQDWNDIYEYRLRKECPPLKDWCGPPKGIINEQRKSKWIDRIITQYGDNSKKYLGLIYVVFQMINILCLI